MKEQPTQPVSLLFAYLYETLDEPEQFALVERAAIAEYDGGLSQFDAEKLAYELYRAGRLNIQQEGAWRNLTKLKPGKRSVLTAKAYNVGSRGRFCIEGVIAAVAGS